MLLFDDFVIVGHAKYSIALNNRFKAFHNLAET